MLVMQYIGHHLQEALVCLNTCHLVTVTCVYLKYQRNAAVHHFLSFTM